MKRPVPERGTSLIEILMSIAIVGMIVPALFAAAGWMMREDVRVEERNLAVELARSMMEEIVILDFEDLESPPGSFGPEESGRSRFDDVDDYAGWSASPPVDSAGRPVEGADGYRRLVSVDNVSVRNPDLPAARGSTPLKRIRVSVESPHESVTLQALKASSLAGGTQ